MEKTLKTNEINLYAFRNGLMKMALFISLLSSLLFIIIYIYMELFFVVGLVLLFGGLFSVTYVFLFLKKEFLAKIWLLSVFILDITFICFLFSVDSGFQFYFFIASIIAPVVLDMQKRKNRIIAYGYLGISLLFFLFFHNRQYQGIVHLPLSWLRIFENITLLTVALSLFIIFTSFIRVLAGSEQRFYKASITDPLTGVLNRGGFFAKLQDEWIRSQRYNLEFSLLLFDLDFFKSLNDRYGHQAGDKSLCRFADLVSSCLRESDVFGRIGGEEFMILMVNTGTASALVKADSIRKNISSEVFYWESQPVSFTVSVGVSSFLKSDKTLDEVYSRADKALYKAKTEGRNRVASH